MRDICRLLLCALVGLFRSRASLEAEILLLQHQLNVLRRKSPKRMAFTDIDRLVFAGLYHLAPGVLNALKIVKPETVVRWLPSLLAQEIRTALGPAADTARAAPAHSRC
jgi:hypothetical protein